jgi:hypothetical protein
MKQLYSEVRNDSDKESLLNFCNILNDSDIETNCVTEYYTRTGRRIDILIKIIVKKAIVGVIAIENKIDSGEQLKQIEDYQRNLIQQFPSIKKMLLFLTPDCRAAQTARDFKKCPCVLSSYDTIATVFESINQQVEEAHLKFLTSAIATHISRGEKIMQEEIRQHIRQLYCDAKHRRTLKLIQDYTPTFSAIQNSIADRLDNSSIIDGVKMVGTYFCGEKEIKLESVELNKLLGSQKITVVFMLHCNETPDIGAKYVFRVMLWEHKLANKTASERLKIRDLRKKQLGLPESRHDLWECWEWVSLWVGDQYVLVDLGGIDTDGLVNLMKSEIQAIYPKLKKRVISLINKNSVKTS